MQLWSDRTFLGSMPGSFESWLLLRSLRTLQIRIKRQSETATALVQWLDAAASSEDSYDGIPAGIISKVWHSSLQHKQGSKFDPSKQMPGGHGATFAIFVSS
jgi:cystathionine gamma-synthase